MYLNQIYCFQNEVVKLNVKKSIPVQISAE